MNVVNYHMVALLMYSIVCAESVFGSNHTKWQLQRQWVSANFGSTLAAPPVFSDFNRDGHLDAVILSFDGELMLLDASGNGETLPNTDWPAYHHGHHFYASPVLFDVDQDGIEEIVIISFNGTLFVYNWRGELLNSTKLPTFFVKKNDLTGKEDHLVNLLNTGHTRRTDPSFELRPEVYSSPLLVDLNADGRLEELVFVTNYGILQRKVVDNDVNFLFGVLIVFNLSTLSTTQLKFTDITKRQSEFPAYFLSDPVWFSPPGLPPHIAATNARGRLYIWRAPKLEIVPKFPYTYGSSTQSPFIIWPNRTAAVVMMDHWGNTLALDLNCKELWERTLKGSPTAAKRWFRDDKEMLVIGTDRGYVYMLTSNDGHIVEGYPVMQSGMKFSAPPLLMQSGDGRELVGLLGLESDVMAVMDLANPNVTFRTTFFGEKSHLGPSLLPYKVSERCSLFLPFTDGAVGCYSPITQFFAGSSSAFRLVNLYPYQSLSIYAGADFYKGGRGSELHVYGETTTIILHISDRSPAHLYKLRIYLSGKLTYSEDLKRHGFHHVTFNLDASQNQGLLLVEVESKLIGEVVRDHLWLKRASFIHHYGLSKIFSVIFFFLLFLFLGIHMWRQRNLILLMIDCREVLVSKCRRFRRQIRPSQGDLLPTVHRQKSALSFTLIACYPLIIILKVVKNVVTSIRRVYSRARSRRQSRLF